MLNDYFTVLLETVHICLGKLVHFCLRMLVIAWSLVIVILMIFCIREQLYCSSCLVIDDDDDIDHSELVAAWYCSQQPPLRISALEPWVKNKKSGYWSFVKIIKTIFCQHINKIDLGDF